MWSGELQACACVWLLSQGHPVPLQPHSCSRMWEKGVSFLSEEVWSEREQLVPGRFEGVESGHLVLPMDFSRSLQAVKPPGFTSKPPAP